MTDPTPVEGCDLCGDVPEALFLHARCHPSAPLRARKEQDVLILTCYLPTCGREVARLRLAPPGDLAQWASRIAAESEEETE